MTDNRMEIWQALFREAMAVVDAAIKMGLPADAWSFGGGTVLMLQYQHRFSKDIDIFVEDPQYLSYLSPRLNSKAEDHPYDEQHKYIKLYYPEGEVDFVAAPSISSTPFAKQEILGREVNTETPLEIVAKKIRFRADQFKARDIYDLALVIENAPDVVPELESFLAEQRNDLKNHVEHSIESLREDFAAIDTINYTPSFEHCLKLLQRHAKITFSPRATLSG